MNTNSYLNTAITAHLMHEKLDDARTRSRVAVVRRARRRARFSGTPEVGTPARRQWFSRPVTA